MLISRWPSLRPSLSWSLAFSLALVFVALGPPAAAGVLPEVEIEQETFDIPSAAQPAQTPGTAGVVVTNGKLLTQLGSEADLNQARYTRFRRAGPGGGGPDPDTVILILVPGFEGGAASFTVLAENLIARSFRMYGMELEVWAFDRRSNQLEDLEGLDIAEQALDPLVGVDWLFGAELGLTIHPLLSQGPDRRAVFYNSTTDIPFLANWTPLVISQDIDAVVEEARTITSNVFLGGHSAGTGFTARYAATDFNLSEEGEAEPGYAKLKGLVLIEGGGGSTGDAPSDEELDLIEARFDGGLFGAVRDQAPRCIDGATACTPETEAVDCAAFTNTQCVEPTASYAVVPGLLNPRVLSTLEVLGLQMASGDRDDNIAILQQDLNGPDSSALDRVSDLAGTAGLPTGTAQGVLGTFIDDDGFIAQFASFVATSVGAPGPVVNELLTWQSIDEEVPASAFVDNGPAPTELPAGTWGVEAEPTLFSRVEQVYYKGETNFTDWYYPSSGLGTTSPLGLDTSALSLDPPLGRGRRDIDNRTQTANIDIPVIALGGSNGLTPVPEDFLAFAQSIAPCSAASCDGTPRVVSTTLPNEAFPTFGNVDGGFEVHISEGYSHVDVVTAEDLPGNEVVRPTVDFLARVALPAPSSGSMGLCALLSLALLRRRAR